MSRLDVISWNKSDIHFKVDELSWRGVSLVELVDAVKYTWVDVKVVGTPFVMNIKATIGINDITVGEPLYWLVLPMGLEKRICNFLTTI